MPAPNQQDDQLTEADLAKLRKAHERYMAATGTPQMAVASTITQGNQKFVVYFRDEADQKRLADLFKAQAARDALLLEARDLIGTQGNLLKTQLALNERAVAQATTANKGATSAQLFPVQLWSGTGDARVCRTVHVQTQAQAEAIRDYVMMMVHEARASIAPVINVQPAPVQVELLAMPERKTESTITRNAQGDITKVVQVEKTVG